MARGFMALYLWWLCCGTLFPGGGTICWAADGGGGKWLKKSTNVCARAHLQATVDQQRNEVEGGWLRKPSTTAIVQGVARIKVGRGYNGTRLGEAKNPGPYTEGGASGSAQTWVKGDYGRWEKGSVTQGAGMVGRTIDVDAAFVDLERWLDDGDRGDARQPGEEGEFEIGTGVAGGVGGGECLEGRGASEGGVEGVRGWGHGACRGHMTEI